MVTQGIEYLNSQNQQREEDLHRLRDIIAAFTQYMNTWRELRDSVGLSIVKEPVPASKLIDVMTLAMDKYLRVITSLKKFTEISASLIYEAFQ